MIPSYVRRWHRDAKEAAEADEDGLDCDVRLVTSHRDFCLCYTGPGALVTYLTHQKRSFSGNRNITRVQTDEMIARKHVMVSDNPHRYSVPAQNTLWER